MRKTEHFPRERLAASTFGFPEILAPAGSMEALIAAVHCGADAVYLGATMFSARQNAHNFDADALQEATDFCHTYGVKVYLTVNTVVFDTEWQALDALLQTAATCGIDACIVQDLGVAAYLKQRIPEMPLHASTQMTIVSPAGAIWAKEHGFSRVVVARELTRSEIQSIAAVGLEVEQFVHGALCMCLSGQCYLSAMIGGRSANRGCCAQACRLPFSATESKTEAALSLKDLSLLSHYRELCADGITSLKIEGRMKRPEYVAAAVTALRQLREGKKPDFQGLRAVFSRSGFTDGYYTGKRQQMFGTRQKEDVMAAKAVLPKLAELAKQPMIKQPLVMTATVQVGMPVSLTTTLPDGTSCIVTSEKPAEAAWTHPCDANFLKKQLGKLGNTHYVLQKLNANCDEQAAVSAATLNAMRRQAVATLEKTCRERNTPQYRLAPIPELPAFSSTTFQQSENASMPAFWVEVRTMNQLQTVQQSTVLPIAHILLPLSLAEQLQTPIPQAILTLPTFVSEEHLLLQRLLACRAAGWTDALCDTIGHLILCRNAGLQLHGGTGLNITNRHSLTVLQQFGVKDALLSVELTARQGRAMQGILPVGMFAYGHFPVMKMRLCPILRGVPVCRLGRCNGLDKSSPYEGLRVANGSPSHANMGTSSRCKSCPHQLKDRTGRTFPVFCTEQYTVLYNAVPTYVADKLMLLQDFSLLLLSFSVESPSEVREILAAYADPIHAVKPHFYRGIRN